MNKKPFERRIRVAMNIRKVVSNSLREKINDPRLSNVTVTDVVLSKDLRIAKVYFTHYKNKKEIIDIFKGFSSAKGHMKKEISKKLRLRYIPEILFLYDKSFEYGEHMDKIFKVIKI